jgi:hypothetical protein
MLKSLWRTHSCVPRSHSCERYASALAPTLGVPGHANENA